MPWIRLAAGLVLLVLVSGCLCKPGPYSVRVDRPGAFASLDSTSTPTGPAESAVRLGHPVLSQRWGPENYAFRLLTWYGPQTALGFGGNPLQLHPNATVTGSFEIDVLKDEARDWFLRFVTNITSADEVVRQSWADQFFASARESGWQLEAEGRRGRVIAYSYSTAIPGPFRFSALLDDWARTGPWYESSFRAGERQLLDDDDRDWSLVLSLATRLVADIIDGRTVEIRADAADQVEVKVLENGRWNRESRHKTLEEVFDRRGWGSPPAGAALYGEHEGPWCPGE